MEIEAKIKYLRMSPRKVRVVAGLIRGLRARDAENQLRFVLKRASHPLQKLLKSAVANAENNFNLKKRNLYVSEIRVDAAPVLKRFRPRAFGRASGIKKRMSHVSLVLGLKEGPEVDEIFEQKRYQTRLAEEKVTAEKSFDSGKRGTEQSFFKKRGGFTAERASRTVKKSADFVRRIFNRKAI